ncbi:hypothetical protein KCU93_g6140, partial [Aureobasidium melanogenum]
MTRDPLSADQSVSVPSTDRGSVGIENYGDHLYTDNDFEIAACMIDFDQDSCDIDLPPDNVEPSNELDNALSDYNDDFYDEKDFDFAEAIPETTQDPPVRDVEAVNAEPLNVPGKTLSECNDGLYDDDSLENGTTISTITSDTIVSSIEAGNVASPDVPDKELLDDDADTYDPVIDGEPEDQEYIDSVEDSPEDVQETKILLDILGHSESATTLDSFSFSTAPDKTSPPVTVDSSNESDSDVPLVVALKRKKKTLSKEQKSAKNKRRRANIKSKSKKSFRVDGCIQWSTDGQKAIDLMSEEEVDRCAQVFLDDVRQNQRKRMEQASKVAYLDVGSSPFTLGFWREYQESRFIDKVETRIKLLKKIMSRRTMAIMGRSIETGREYLEIGDVSDEELKKMGVYLSMIFNESGVLVGLYVGSRTGQQGVYQRTEQYERAKQTGKIPKAEANSAHLNEALKEGYTWQIRPLALADRDQATVSTIIALEGMFTDLCNTMYTMDASAGRFRNAAVIEAYKEAVPADMQDVPWKPLNRAHQLRQGARSSHMSCKIPGCHTSPTGKTTLAGFDDDNLVYLCVESCWKRLLKRLKRYPTWSWEQQLAYLRTFVSSQKGTWHRRSHGAVKETLNCWCAEGDPLYSRCEIVAGEENISCCKKCYYNWDHFKKKYLVSQPPEVKRKHWARFVKHQKSGVRVGNFKWVEHDCDICGAEANRTPPPGYPKRDHVKLCYKCYDAAKATKKTWKAWKDFMIKKYGNGR